jgi:polyhydroxybutyrate depolymerase
MAMKSKKKVIGAVLAAIGLPLVLVLIVPAPVGVVNPIDGTIVSSGQKREYVLYVPKSYDRARPTPLVISLHGAATGPATQMGISQWNRVADQHGFIVVYPSGTGFPKVWPMEPEATLQADVRFISDLIDKLEAAYNIEAARIYVNGFSNGGGMTFALSCTLSDRIAAVGMVGAAQLLSWRWCTDSRPVPMIAFHGTADRFAPYNGGSSPIAPGTFPSVPAWTENWARRNRCGSNPAESVVAADVTRLEYKDCADDAAVVLYTLRGTGHQWPGGKPFPESFAGPTSNSIDASSVMWEFFVQHPR